MVGLLDQPHPKVTACQVPKSSLCLKHACLALVCAAVWLHHPAALPLRLLQFEQIKHRYPHAVLGWSKKKDCLVTVSCNLPGPRPVHSLCAGSCRKLLS